MLGGIRCYPITLIRCCVGGALLLYVEDLVTVRFMAKSQVRANRPGNVL